MTALVMCIDDKRAFARPKAYPARCEHWLRAYSRHPSTQFHRNQLGTKTGELTVCQSWSRRTQLFPLCS